MNRQARARTQELHKAQQEAARRQALRRKVITIVSGVVILALVAAIVWAVVRAAGGDDSTATGGGDVVTPANVTEDDTIPVGQGDARVTIDIFYDYMCPVCGSFEEANSEELTRLVEDGTARLELHPMSFLDRMSSGTEYSTRSANAIATVADGAPESVWAFHGALYENQPEEGSSGLSDEEIADIAEEAGVPADVVDRFTDRTYDGWVASVTKQAGDDGVNGTPTVWIDGENFDGDLFTPGVLTEAVESAAGEQ